MLILIREKSAAVPDLTVKCKVPINNYFLSTNSQADTALDWAGLEEEE